MILLIVNIFQGRHRIQVVVEDVRLAQGTAHLPALHAVHLHPLFLEHVYELNPLHEAHLLLHAAHAGHQGAEHAKLVLELS